MGSSIDWFLKGLLGYLFFPFILIIIILLSDASVISQIIGERIILVGISSYQDLAKALEDNLLNHPRSEVITSYALYGFAHVASMAIFVGGISALVTGRTAQISKIAVKALITVTFACLLTACIAGAFFNKLSVLLGS
jgi:concentrative nucleoside transporter, CNT family